MAFGIIKLLVVLALLAIILCILRTLQMEHSANQNVFEKGTLPNPAPNGLYSGSINRKVSWQGKKFDAANSNGINVFEGKGDAYPFVTAIGKGMRETDKDVFKIDYDIAANPWWMRYILDEIVQVGPDEYLGKLQVRFLPWYPYTLGFFTLKK